MTQPSLFAPGVPYQSASATSKAGAAFAFPKAGTQAQAVLAALQGRSLTRRELSERCGLSIQAVCGRVGMLQRQGLIRAVGVKAGPCGVANELLTAVDA